MSNNVNTARNAYEKAHAEHERLAALKKSLPNGPEKNKATSNFTKSQGVQVAALLKWQNARAAAKGKAAAAGRTRKQRTNRRRYTRKH
jgi:hypothetical protein